MPEYVAKAWYKDLATWVNFLTVLTGVLADPSITNLIPAPYLPKLITLVGVANQFVRSSTARPIGSSDGSRSVKVHHIEIKDSANG